MNYIILIHCALFCLFIYGYVRFGYERIKNK